MCFGLAELWKMLLKSLSLSVLFLGHFNTSVCLHRQFRCLSLRVSHPQKCLEAAFRKCASVSVVFLYTTRACFRDTGVCQGTDWQFGLHMHPWTLDFAREINMSASFFLVISDGPMEADQISMHLWHARQDHGSLYWTQRSVQPL